MKHRPDLFDFLPGMEPFPGYRLRSPLGRGGFSEVWMADNPQGKRVALKFLAGDGRRSTTEELRALQTIREFRHPHLLRIEQVWCKAGFIVVAMELADGSLAGLLDVYRTEFGTPVDAEHACLWLGEAAEALDFLNAPTHEVNGRTVGIQHCDVKPSNLLLVGETLKLADFGLAAALAERSPPPPPRGGTPVYCAPEVFGGRLSPFTDQYALAVSYCELRTGRLPFRTIPDALRPSFDRTPDLTHLPEAERPAIARALHAVPEKRWPTCGALLDQLRQAAGARSVAC
jgi:serine/threonine protein kinase, bacterial